MKSTETKYEYTNNTNKKSEKEIREEKIIIFGSKSSIKNLNDENIREFFIDITFKAIPKKFWPYKLMTITCFDNKSKSTKICCFACIKYLDTTSYIKTFKFINELFDYNPSIVHIDYESSLKKALKEENLFKKPILHTFCYFYFSKAIKEHMNLNLFKKKLNKRVWKF